MRSFFASASALLLLSGIALAQSPIDRFEVFGGYSLVTGDFTGTHADRAAHSLNGWNASANYKADRLVGLVADFSGYRASYSYLGLGGFTVRARSESLMLGPQVSVRLSKLTPFAHALVGITHIGYPQPSGCSQCLATSDNSFSYALGGGLDYYLTRHIGVRGQADLFHTGATSSDDQLTYKYHQSTARVSAGVVVRF